MVVKPLPLETTDSVPSPRNRVVIAAIGAGVVVLAFIVFFIATGGDSKLAAMPSPSTKPEVAPPQPAEPPPLPPPPLPAPPVEPTPTPIEVAAPPPPVDVARAPARPIAKKPVAKKPVAKKPVARPKYDPNSLFLKGP